MTDAELIARLRLYGSKFHHEFGHNAAADRIEALTKERDEADDLAKAAFADGASNNIRLAETSYRVKWLEAKLAKAVEETEKYKYAFAAQSRKLQAVLHIEGVKEALAELKGTTNDQG